MEITATHFRKNLFQLLDRASKGELIEIGYKGAPIRLGTAKDEPKLSRLIRRKTYNGTPEELESALHEQDEAVRNEWDRKWESRL